MKMRIAGLLILALCANGCIAAAAVATHRARESRQEAARSSSSASDAAANSQYKTQTDQTKSQKE